MREFDLLRSVFAKNALLPSHVLVPPGDDMAVVRTNDPVVLIAVDQIIEGRHVRADTDAALVGRKAITRNCSDVAAMAALPTATVVAVALPPDYGTDRALALFEGLRATADLFGCPLVGGDLAFHEDPRAPLVCSVTIMASPAWTGARVITRSGSQLGDGLYVTGRLGGSLDPDGGGRHLTFDPRMDEGVALLKDLGARLHAMIDISDGLGRDAAHLLENDSCAGLMIDLDARAIPAHRGVPWQRAVTDGEDYELLFTATGQVPSTVCGTPVTRIGTVIERAGGIDGESLVLARDGSNRVDVSRAGWEHAS
ncbi:MAG: thiamine-phosphate kinase [Phycisphaerae bacterium]|nr:thiamine-phosphate kinase [Phycisphaerae bacterium]